VSRLGLGDGCVSAFAVTFSVGWCQGGFVPHFGEHMVGLHPVADCKFFPAEITVCRLLLQLGCAFAVVASVKVTLLSFTFWGLHLHGGTVRAVRASACKLSAFQTWLLEGHGVGFSPVRLVNPGSDDQEEIVNA